MLLFFCHFSSNLEDAKENPQKESRAKCTIPKRFLHPKRVIDSNAYYHNRQGVEGLLIIGREERTINNKRAMCCIFRHEHFDDNVTLYCIEKFAKVTEEGHEDHFFVPSCVRASDGVAGGSEGGNVNTAGNPNLSEDRLREEREEGAIPFRLTHRVVDDVEDIARIRDMGFSVDDDNEPAPENVPDSNEPVVQNGNVPDSNEQVVQNGLLSIHNQAWRDDVYMDKAAASRGMMARLRCIDKLKNSMEVFLLLFGDGLLELILNSTNQNLPHGAVKMTKGELVRYLGMQLAISTTSGFARDDFWTSELMRKEMWRAPPYNFNLLLSKARFLLITKHLSFCSSTPPAFRDKFWRVREMINEWNRNMADVVVGLRA